MKPKGFFDGDRRVRKDVYGTARGRRSRAVNDDKAAYIVEGRRVKQPSAFGNVLRLLASVVGILVVGLTCCVIDRVQELWRSKRST